MRTKKIWLLAAMLLSSVCATFAQSESEHPLSFILGVHDAQGEDYGSNWAVENWTASIKKDDSDPNKVWIYSFTPAPFAHSIYGVVNEEKTEIRFPVNQPIGSYSNYDVVLEAYINEGNDKITDFIVGTISEDGTITIAPTTWIAATAYYKGTRAGYYSCDRSVVFKKNAETSSPSGIILNDENFPDKNFRMVLSQNFGISEGEDLLVGNVNTTLLNLEENNIANLRGIEYFTMLETLYCYNNQLTALDVSKNTELKYLSCYSNQIKGTAMDALVASLPTVEEGVFYVINTKDANEENVCTKSQVAVAKEKGWTVYNYNGNSYNRQEYEGSDPNIKAVILNAANFPDTNFRAALASKFGISEGDEITEAKIAATTSINVYNDKIADLTGIEHFTALTELWCSDNQLTSLDVSKNTALRKLDCGSNQLTSLDVSKNTALTYLQCWYNQLTSLDVSKNTALTDLTCSRNQLTSLDVSKNTALTELVCSSNPLTSLDVSKNTALKTLECSSNQLTSLDVSNNTALTWLFCDNNQLTSLDVSKNTALTFLSCSNNPLTSLDVSKNTALTRLQCYSNQLTSLDVSQNTALISLYCEGNQLTSLNVSGCTALGGLDCSDNQLTSLNVSGCIALTYLNCYNNQFKGEAMDALVASLPTVESGDFVVINTKDANEGNVCTKSQVTIAKGKGWTVYDYNYDGENWIGSVEYEGSEDVEQEIDPVDEDDNIDYGSDMDENSNLDGNVIGNVYYNVGNGNGEYDAENGCVVIKKTTDDGTVDELEGKDIFGDDFKGTFTGIVFKVPTGKGTVKVTAETTGNMLLKVKIGSDEPVEMELEGKLKISFPYNVTSESLVYIYAGTSAEAKGLNATSSTDAALKIYGIEFLRDDTPTDIDRPTPDPSLNGGESWYTIDGVKLNGEPRKKGVYIHNGKKVVK